MFNSWTDWSSHDLGSLESEIEVLARATDTPIEIVRGIYNAEHAKLDQNARIKTYVPVLIYRHVKEILQSRRSSIH
jgi:Protein of unknown function (DUF3562)